MKVKLEIKSSDASTNPLFTVFMEHKENKFVEFFVTRFNVRQLKMESNPSVEPENIPICDGKFLMNKDSLKEFIAALQLLVKGFKKK